MKEAKTPVAYTDAQTFEGRLPLIKAIPFGLQHVLAMFVGNLTPLIIICGACGIGAGSEYASVYVQLLQNAMLIAGVVTLIQLFSIGPVGGKVPIIMGTSSGFIGVFQSIAGTMGGGLLTYGAMMGACFIGGLFEAVLGAFLKPLRRFFPPIVTGTVVTAIGLSLISVGTNSFGGGASAGDFGSAENLFVGGMVLIVILGLTFFGKGMWSSSAILIGIIFGYILCFAMGTFMPTTFINADGLEVTKSWVLNFSKVQDAAWFAVPSIMPVKMVFDVRAIGPILVMFIVTGVETIGDITAVIEGGMHRQPTDKELAGGVMCDGIGSTIASIFGVLPNTSFSQNVGLVSITGVVNRMALSCGAIILILAGLFPKLSALISIMPQSVLGGAAVMMFSSIIMSGVGLITKEPLDQRSITIVAIALGLGYGIGTNSGIIAQLPMAMQLIFGESGIVSAAFIAILMNIILPKKKAAVAETADAAANASADEASEQ